MKLVPYWGSVISIIRTPEISSIERQLHFFHTMAIEPFRVSNSMPHYICHEAQRPLQINIPDSELDLLQRKLELARLPTNLDQEQWAESNGVTVSKVQEVVDFWRASYSWRDEEAKLNHLPQYKIHLAVKDFGDVELHFVHSASNSTNAVPLLFIHGWPGSFAEVTKVLPILMKPALTL